MPSSRSSPQRPPLAILPQPTSSDSSNRSYISNDSFTSTATATTPGITTVSTVKWTVLVNLIEDPKDQSIMFDKLELNPTIEVSAGSNLKDLDEHNKRVDRFVERVQADVESYLLAYRAATKDKNGPTAISSFEDLTKTHLEVLKEDGVQTDDIHFTFTLDTAKGETTISDALAKKVGVTGAVKITGDDIIPI